MSENISAFSRREKCFSLDIPFYRTDYSAEDDSYRRMGCEDGYYKVRIRQALARTCWQSVTFLDPQAGNLGTPAM
jgi:hypothetical protein